MEKKDGLSGRKNRRCLRIVLIEAVLSRDGGQNGMRKDEEP